MKAKDLAKKLMKYPDFDVRFGHSDPTYAGNLAWGIYIRQFDITDIGDIGHSEKVILLDGEEI